MTGLIAGLEGVSGGGWFVYIHIYILGKGSGRALIYFPNEMEGMELETGRKTDQNQQVQFYNSSFMILIWGERVRKKGMVSARGVVEGMGPTRIAISARGRPSISLPFTGRV